MAKTDTTDLFVGPTLDICHIFKFNGGNFDPTHKKALSLKCTYLPYPKHIDGSLHARTHMLPAQITTKIGLGSGGLCMHMHASLIHCAPRTKDKAL